MNCIPTGLLFAGMALTPVSATAAERLADPAAARRALTVLLAASNAEIPRASSCYGDYGQEGPSTVKDLLSMHLAYLYNGENTIEGACVRDSCSITITHAAGEDVFSATIDFRIRKGSVDPATLRCLITP